MNRRIRGFGLIEVLIVLLLVGIAFFLIRHIYGKGGSGTAPVSYNELYDDAKKKLEKVKADQPGY